MKILAGLKELIYNFTHPIKDNNVIETEISDDNFLAIAMASGMSSEAIKVMQKNRNGININSISKVIRNESTKESTEEENMSKHQVIGKDIREENER